MSKVKVTYVYKMVHDCKIQADVYRCPGEERRPAILWLHGGALIFGNRSMLPGEQMELYLAAGYTVISIDYRLAPETKLQGDVPLALSQQMAAALQEQHVVHQFIIMKGLGHAFDVFPQDLPEGQPGGLKHPKVGQAFDEVVTFLNEHMDR